MIITFEPSANINETSGNLSWVLIKVYYNASEVASKNIDESKLKLYWWNGSVWKAITEGANYSNENGPYVYDAGVDVNNNYVWANLSHLSVYGVGGSVVTTAAVTTTAGVYSPEVTILANSIDLKLAKEFVDYLEDNGITVYLVDKTNFSDYNKKLYIIILGGQEAPEGVGEIVSEILTEDEKSEIKQDKAC